MISHAMRRLAALAVAVFSALGLTLVGVGAVGAEPADPPPASSGDQSADNLGWNTQVYAVNGDTGASNIVNPGDEVTYRSNVWENSKAGGWLNTGRYLTAIRHIAPAGFEYVDATVTKDATIVNQGDDGVKATCTGGGCSSVPLVGTEGFKIKGSTVLRFTVTYKVPEDFEPGDYDSGFVFDVYTFETQQGSASAGAQVRVVDNKESTTTEVSAPTQVGVNSDTTLSATVSPADATGDVQFFIDGAPAGDPQPVDDQGHAQLTHRFDTMDTYEVSAEFTATGLFHDSAAASPVQIEVGEAETATALTVPASAQAGDTVTLEAHVTPADAAGTVQFTVDGADVGNAVQVVDGAATIEHRFDDTGDHDVAATFSGAYGVADSAAGSQTISVDYAPWRTTTVVVEPVTAEAGSPANLKATVRPIPTGGDVTFSVEGTEIGTADVGTADGVAVLEHTFAAAGTYQVTATFNGTDGFDASTSAPFTATVADPPPVLTAVEAGLQVDGPAVVGQTLTLTATLDPADADGTVQFYKGTTKIGEPVAVVDGTATATTELKFTGTQVLTAEFTGGDGYRDSVSEPVVIDVASAPEAPEDEPSPLASLAEGSLGELFAGSLGA